MSFDSLVNSCNYRVSLRKQKNKLCIKWREKLSKNSLNDEEIKPFFEKWLNLNRELKKNKISRTTLYDQWMRSLNGKDIEIQIKQKTKVKKLYEKIDEISRDNNQRYRNVYEIYVMKRINSHTPVPPYVPIPDTE